MDDPAPISPLETVVAVLLASVEQLRGVLDHMEDYERGGFSAPGADPPHVVLHRLLVDILEPVLTDEDVMTATERMLATVTRTVGAELFLVSRRRRPAPAPRRRRPL